jgi:hypothetical protein
MILLFFLGLPYALSIKKQVVTSIKQVFIPMYKTENQPNFVSNKSFWIEKVYKGRFCNQISKPYILKTMTKSRRNFCKDAFYFGLGLSVVPFISIAKSPGLVIGSSLNLVKKAQRVLKINGKIKTANHNPVPNATIEIWHTNSENNPLNFEYMGKLSTDSNGAYSLLTDLPEKHFDDGYFRMRRLFLKIVNTEREAFSTALYIGEMGSHLLILSIFKIRQ